MFAAKEPRRRLDRSSPAEGTTSVELLKTAYEEGRRAVDKQMEELSGMRQRAIQFMAFVGSATAFLVGSTLSTSSDRTTPFYIGAALASLVSLVALVALIFVLLSIVIKPGSTRQSSKNEKPSRLGRAVWNHTIAPDILVRDWIRPSIGATAQEEFYEDLAYHYGDAIAENDEQLKKVQTSYWIFVGLGGLQVIAWVTLVWIFA